jgi:rhamnogalacturonyl hydrolase YesR
MPSRRRFRAAIGLALLGVMASIAAQAADAARDTALQAAQLPRPEAVLDVVRRSASAEVARLNQAETDPAAGRAVDANWVSATFFVGAMKLVEAADAPDVSDFATRSAQRFHYAFHGDAQPVDLIDADYQAIGDLYQALYLRSGAPGMLLPLKQRLDYSLRYLQQTPAPQKLVWWWCDVLFMAPPVMARMSAITGDSRYLQAMDVQWWRAYERLYDRDEHLYKRYEGSIEAPSPNAKKPFWSRGQGWVIAGLARMLETMPQDFARRPRYVQLYQQMVTRIVALQQPDGLWRASLLDPQAYPEPETSGTAFFAYALAFGINHGLLDRNTFLPPLLEAWAGLNRYVLPSGILGQVRTGSNQAAATLAESTTLYASGAFIMAGVEVAKLGLPVTSLPLKLPSPPKPRPDSSVATRPVPEGASPEQIREQRRREAERDAIARLRFDPLADDADFTSPLLSAPAR